MTRIVPVSEQVMLRFILGCPMSLVGEFNLDGTEEALHRGIVIGNAYRDMTKSWRIWSCRDRRIVVLAGAGDCRMDG